MASLLALCRTNAPCDVATSIWIDAEGPVDLALLTDSLS